MCGETAAKIRIERVPAGGEIDEVFYSRGALQAVYEVEGGEEFVFAGEVEKDGVDGVRGEEVVDPLGVLD